MASKNRGGKKSSPLGSSSYNSIDQGELLKKAIQRVVCEPIFKDFKKHGNSTWNPSSIAILAILTAWMPSPQLTEAFAKASELSTKLFGVLAIQTYQGMMRAMVNNGSSLVMILYTPRVCPYTPSDAQGLSLVTGTLTPRVCPWF